MVSLQALDGSERFQCAVVETNHWCLLVYDWAMSVVRLVDCFSRSKLAPCRVVNDSSNVAVALDTLRSRSDDVDDDRFRFDCLW